MKAVIFDVDGTLVESMSVDTELFFRAVEQVLGTIELRENLLDYQHVTDAGILRQVFTDNGVTDDGKLYNRIRQRFVDALGDHIRRNGPLPRINGATDFLHDLRASADYRVAIATGGWRHSALLKLETAGFRVADIPLVTCDDNPSRTGIMSTALARLGGEFESITYFGDAEWDRRACDTLGWRFIGVGSAVDGIENYVDFHL